MSVISQQVLDMDGSIGGVIKVALKHFAFVQPRWDSAATPTREVLNHISLQCTLLI